tara:strand:- start:520 stop:990 length:471 start_codon:yes stop_codon:yes gene_type:complete
MPNNLKKAGIKYKKGKEVYNNGGGNPNIQPTATDTLQAYMHQVVPGSVSGQVDNLKSGLMDDAKKSHDLTGDMTYQDFKDAADRLGLNTRTDVMKHLTGKTPDDLHWTKRGLLKSIVDMDKSLRTGGATPGSPVYAAKNSTYKGGPAPGMINGTFK